MSDEGDGRRPVSGQGSASDTDLDVAAVDDHDDAGPGKHRDFVQSLDRGLAIIRVFNADRPRLTVSEIGRRVGLSDASHFIRQCRATLGVTPAVLRRAR